MAAGHTPPDVLAALDSLRRRYLDEAHTMRRQRDEARALVKELLEHCEEYGERCATHHCRMSMCEHALARRVVETWRAERVAEGAESETER